MNAQIFFSVIIPTHDRKPYLEKAVRSVLEQSWANFELIVVDDGSTDGTRKMVESIEDERLRYFRHPNRGVSFSRNRGLKEASGNWIAFLDSDDWWKPGKLKKNAEYILEFPGLKIFHTEEIWYRNGNLLPQKKKHKKPTGDVYEKALPLCCISISTAVINRAVFDEIGMFDESFEACEDYDFWLRATNKYKVKLIPEYLTLKDGGRPDQLSSRTWGMDRFRIKALGKMLASGELTTSRYEATFRTLKKKCYIFAKGAEKRGRDAAAARYRKLPEKYRWR
jgi:glycosyltransferase involved in cell wall biosynthesis